MIIADKIVHDQETARAHIEASRWAGEPTCPYCGSVRVRCKTCHFHSRGHLDIGGVSVSTFLRHRVFAR